MPDSRRLVLTRALAPDSYTLAMLDASTGDARVFHTSPETISSATVARDGKRLAFVTGRLQWRGAEIGIPDGRMRALPATGPIAGFPDWNPDGTRYLSAAYRDGRWVIDETSATARFSRRVAEVDQGITAHPRWAPDGSQFTFISMLGVSLNPAGSVPPRGVRVMLSNMSGRVSPLDPAAERTGDAIWSSDGQFVIYTRTLVDKSVEVARLRPGSAASPEILARYAWGQDATTIPVASSPAGDGILARSTRTGALFVLTSDYGSARPVTQRVLEPVGFTRDGREIVGVFRKGGTDWQLWSTEVATGRERLLATLNLSITAYGIAASAFIRTESGLPRQWRTGRRTSGCWKGSSGNAASHQDVQARALARLAPGVKAPGTVPHHGGLGASQGARDTDRKVMGHAAADERLGSNNRIDCRAHNAYEARLFFGPDVVREEGAWWADSFRNELTRPYGICIKQA
jgi:Tol biopolymer transport system component